MRSPTRASFGSMHRGKAQSEAESRGKRGRRRNPRKYFKRAGRAVKGLFRGVDNSRNDAGKNGTPMRSLDISPRVVEKIHRDAPKLAEDTPLTASRPRKQGALPSRSEDRLVYDIVLDNGTSATSAGKTIEGKWTKEFPVSEYASVTLVIVLMEGESRHFELLHLDFETETVVARDLIAQLHLFATEESLRKQTYSEICGVNGDIIIGDISLRELAKAEDRVVLAIPKGMSTNDCATLARPILNDPKVKYMVRRGMLRSGLPRQT